MGGRRRPGAHPAARPARRAPGGPGAAELPAVGLWLRPEHARPHAARHPPAVGGARSPRRRRSHRWLRRRVAGFSSAICAWRALQPAPYTRAVATVDIAELALEIGFLAGHYAVADDEGEGHQHDQQPEIVERNGQADQTQERAEVEGVARE